MDSLCHPCITTTPLSSGFLSLKLLPPPCAVLLVCDYEWSWYLYTIWWYVMYVIIRIRTKIKHVVNCSYLARCLATGHLWALSLSFRPLQGHVVFAHDPASNPSNNGHCLDFHMKISKLVDPWIIQVCLTKAGWIIWVVFLLNPKWNSNPWAGHLPANKHAERFTEKKLVWTLKKRWVPSGKLTLFIVDFPIKNGHFQ